MTDCCIETKRLERMGRILSEPELSYADMVARGTYRFVAWAGHAYYAWSESRQAMKALDCLEQLDDRHLADIGLRRDDLSVDALAVAAVKRNETRVTMGFQT